MKFIDIADLNTQLSAHIQIVKNGEEVVVCERNKPVARIVPITVAGRKEQDRLLIIRGAMTPPIKRRPRRFSWPTPPGEVSDEVVEKLWREERGVR